MKMRHLPLLLAVLASGCTETVHVVLAAGDCDQTVMPGVLSVRAQLLRREDSLTIQRCVEVDAADPLADLLELEALLSDTIVFNDLPGDGTWTIRVQGYWSPGCVETTTLLCGKLTGLELPPTGDMLTVEVDCSPRIGSEPPLIKACREDG